jgi:hypothetical protein
MKNAKGVELLLLQTMRANSLFSGWLIQIQKIMVCYKKYSGIARFTEESLFWSGAASNT